MILFVGQRSITNRLIRKPVCQPSCVIENHKEDMIYASAFETGA